MRRKFGKTALWLVVAGTLVTPGAGDTKSAPERNSAISMIRLLKAAEADYFRQHQRYATFADLVQSGQLGKTATDAPENLRAFFLLNFESQGQPFPGFVLSLTVPAEGSTFQLLLEPKSGRCGSFRLVADEQSVSEQSDGPCNTEEEALQPEQDWAPPDVDASVPVVHGDAPCPLATVLEEASRRVLELSENLQKFGAKERIEHREVGKNGKLRGPTTGTFNYIAEVDQTETGTTYIEEYRSALNGTQEPITPLVDTGTAAFALIFHPRHIDEFTMMCEGMSDAGGRPAWLVHFAQRADRNNEFHAYRVKGASYRANIKGRAWVATDNYEVVRMETDLMEPIPAIGLEKEHLVIEYAPVEFHRRDLRLWLPESATLYIDFHGHRYARTHTFSDFKLFSVDTVEKVKEPAWTKDAAGQETPAQGTPAQGTALRLMPGDPAPQAPVPSRESPLTPK